MQTVTSKDGTKIAYSKMGSGPALLLVDGALGYRDFGPSKSLAKLLQDKFTVYIYDRRGRGESGDTVPYSLQKEIDDIDALVDSVGEPVCLFGQSSGGVLVVEAASKLGAKKVRKMAIYETPLFVDNSHEPLPSEFMDRLHQNIAEGRNGAAVKQFMRMVGVPGFALVIMPLLPMWGKLKKVAPTLAYDYGFMQPMLQGKPLSPKQWPGATMPTVAMVGGKSPTWMRNAVQQVAEVLPSSEFQVVPGQNHMVKNGVLAPILAKFFASNDNAV